MCLGAKSPKPTIPAPTPAPPEAAAGVEQAAPDNPANSANAAEAAARRGRNGLKIPMNPGLNIPQ